jgi:hypothetical protein
MDTTIGDAAGQIWTYLHAHGAQSERHLRRGTRLSERLLYMGIGWLAREGKLVFVQDGRVLKLQLHATPDA